MAKKTTPKKTVKKVATKKTATKKAATKKATATKKTTTKKATATKKTTTKKATTASLVQTRIIARVDVGFGNALYLRGEGAGLSWDKGALMENIAPYEWAFSTTRAKAPVAFKCLINDQVWADGENQSVAAGGTLISSPVFHW